MMTQLLKSEALVLHSMRWRESSKILHLFTAEKGLLKVIARGALRPKSTFRGVLENLNHIEVVIGIKDTRELQMVSQAEMINPFSHVRDNLESTAVAYALAELLRKYLHENEASQQIFGFTIAILNIINKPDIIHHPVYLIKYLLFFSEYLGFGWNMSQCRQCGKLPDKFPIMTDPVNGGIFCGNCIHPNRQSGISLSKLQWRLCFRLQEMGLAEIPALTLKIPDHISYLPVIDLLVSHLNYHTDQSFQLKSLKLLLP